MNWLLQHHLVKWYERMIGVDYDQAAMGVARHDALTHVRPKYFQE